MMKLQRKPLLHGPVRSTATCLVKRMKENLLLQVDFRLVEASMTKMPWVGLRPGRARSEHPFLEYIQTDHFSGHCDLSPVP